MVTEFYRGFAWAMPTVFAQAVADCLFEEGDILYDTQYAYGREWGDALPFIQHSIQVREPRRGAARSASDSGSVFLQNWDSTVDLDLHTFGGKDDPQHIQTTQGRLYTTLWTGDLEALPRSTPDPQPPRRLKQLSSELKSITAFAEDLAEAQPVFVMARDLSNKVSRLKHFQVSRAMRAKHGAREKSLTPVELKMRACECIAPTIDVVFYIAQSGTVDDVLTTLKSQLYKPAKGAKSENFRIASHGILAAEGVEHKA